VVHLTGGSAACSRPQRLVQMSMKDSDIRWYSMNGKLAVEEHEPIELEEALKIVDRYLYRGTEKFESAEQAIASTMFGFSRSKFEFIEICVNGPAEISYKFGMSDPDASWFRKALKGVFHHEEELHSREELVQKVEEFFTTPAQEIRKRLGCR
jgi:hypothetical protein